MSLFDVISESLLVLSQSISVVLPVGFPLFFRPLDWYLTSVVRLHKFNFMVLYYFNLLAEHEDPFHLMLTHFLPSILCAS